MQKFKKNIVAFAAFVIFQISSSVISVNGNVIRPSSSDLLQDNEIILESNATIVNGEEESTFTVHPETRICRVLENEPVDIDISNIFPTLNFTASWIRRKYFWLSDDFNFESRYHKNMIDVLRNRKLVKVFILPHSHNDPGWLNTYEQYFYRQTKHILDNAVRKLTELPQMTFVWSEITYLAKWWKEASPIAREQFRKLVVDEKRLEIATGGWVVPDEATSSLYTLLSELTEGQQWIKNNLNTTARYSWAIDPFGHSATHAHLLKQSGMDAMVIQRLHYVWKHWLAEHKKEEFLWRPRWGDSDGSQDIPCFSLPYDLYSIKHACGPEPQVCLKFDFRSIQYEYGENYGLMTPITKSNIRRAAEEITTQYHKTASLTNHNVVLVPLGDDFRYDRSLEWDQQYANYMQLFSYINSNQERFGIEIRFGTLRDYFEAVDEKSSQNNQEAVNRPTLSGDFYPYGDVYVSGEPAYWTGFYGTRPYWKKFHRELENELRSAEILFTYANMLAKRTNSQMELKMLSYKYQDLVEARHEFSVFAHHDGITGTSRKWTMNDYGDRLYASFTKCVAIQQQSLKIIYQKSSVKKTLPAALSKETMSEAFELLPTKTPLEVFSEGDAYATKVMIFNNLGWFRSELVKVLVKRSVVKVTDSKGKMVPSQVNPVLIHNELEENVQVSERMYELVFLANMEALSTAVFKITEVSNKEMEGSSKLSTVACEKCPNLNETSFPVGNTQEDQLVLENEEIRAHFQNNGLLENIFKKRENSSVPVKISFGMYKPTNRQSGAYLLKPILPSEWKFFQYTNHSKPFLIRISGPIMSQFISIHVDRYETMKVNVTLVNTSIIPENSSGPQGLLMETFVDFSRDYSNRAEVYMRFDTGLNSTSLTNSTVQQHKQEESVEQRNDIENSLVMYTDQNGFGSEKRLTVTSLPYEANTYPVTTMAHIQDEREKVRFSVLVDRTHGFCSMEEGRLETLIERKSLYDDGRGMSEGVTDGRPTVSTYVLLVESLSEKGESTANNKSVLSFADWQPTLTAHQSSLRQNYRPNMFVFNEPNEPTQLASEEVTISLISTPLPENVHLLNLRTLSEDALTTSNETRKHIQQSTQGSDGDDVVASSTALLNLQYLWEFGTDLKIMECNVSRLNSSDVETTMESQLPSENLRSSEVHNNMTQSEDQTIPFRMNYLNDIGFVATSLTGVTDRKFTNLTENDSSSSIPKVGKKSLLVSYKLHFV